MANDPAKMALHTIGERLRQLRIAKGMSLRDAATAAGLSASFISLVERGETEIAISRLIRLADTYGIVVADLLDNVHEPAVEFVPAAAAHEIPRAGDEVIVSYLASPSWTMQPFLVRLQPGARLDSLSHTAEEFLHCVSGQPTLIVAGEKQPLSPGDTLFLPPHVEHCYTNPGSEPATLVGAIRREESGDHAVVPRAHGAKLRAGVTVRSKPR